MPLRLSEQHYTLRWVFFRLIELDGAIGILGWHFNSWPRLYIHPLIALANGFLFQRHMLPCHGQHVFQYRNMYFHPRPNLCKL